MLTEKHGKIEGFKVKTGQFTPSKRIRVRGLLWMILLIFWGNGVNAQVYEIIDRKKRNIIADSLMNELKEGVLIVRLRTKHKKLVALNKVLNNKDLSKRQKKRTKKMIKTTISERDKFNQELVSAFYDLYDFSEFYIIHDTSSIHLKDKVKQGIFLNEKMEIDPSISFSDKTYFILSEGSTNEKGIIVDGLIVTTSGGVLPDRPFPNYFSIHDRLKILLLYMFANKKTGEELVKEIVYKFKAVTRKTFELVEKKI